MILCQDKREEKALEMEELTQMSASTEESTRSTDVFGSGLKFPSTKTGLVRLESPLQRTGKLTTTNQTTEIKKWLYTPAEQSAERETICKQLEDVESKLFTLQGLKDLYEENIKFAETNPEQETELMQLKTLLETTNNQVQTLESERSFLLNEYWTKYFKAEWPSASQSLSIRTRATMTSPNMQMAAEKMMALKESSSISSQNSIEWNSEGNSSPRSYVGNKRVLDSSNGQIPVVKQKLDATTAPNEDEVDPSLIRCNCKKSRCLKLYCECFAARKMCVDECKCLECANNSSHSKQREDAIKQVLERRPDAFHTKVFVATSAPAVPTTTTNSSQDIALAHARGCTCRKTKCTKKYCVCFNTQVKCGDWCRCTDCENGKVEYSLVNESSINSSQTSTSSTDKLSVLANITAAALPVQAN